MFSLISKRTLAMLLGALIASRIGDAKFEPCPIKKKTGIVFYLGPADGIDGGIAVYTLATRRLRQDRTWRLL
jgi:hypothetical protein